MSYLLVGSANESTEWCRGLPVPFNHVGIIYRATTGRLQQIRTAHADERSLLHQIKLVVKHGDNAAACRPVPLRRTLLVHALSWLRVCIAWSDITVICGHITISVLWGNSTYCVKLCGEDLLRYSNKIESVGFNQSTGFIYLAALRLDKKRKSLRTYPYYHYLARTRTHQEMR